MSVNRWAARVAILAGVVISGAGIAYAEPLEPGVMCWNLEESTQVPMWFPLETVCPDAHPPAPNWHNM
ncbi:hypothetical protein [Nocardia sp. CS682]|uniref:hypothetical protein n=1 Tax=Nocardia sp. CS682 TaxID=1047172 RepID=UPI001074C3F9|nr:hypothetical protein [Nocardia sp. CS682]QBS45303.1 hypothetical protein DMB37_39730 [Nocardia sp. CS682]